MRGSSAGFQGCGREPPLRCVARLAALPTTGADNTFSPERHRALTTASASSLRKPSPPRFCSNARNGMRFSVIVFPSVRFGPQSPLCQSDAMTTRPAARLAQPQSSPSGGTLPLGRTLMRKRADPGKSVRAVSQSARIGCLFNHGPWRRCCHIWTPGRTEIRRNQQIRERTARRPRAMPSVPQRLTPKCAE